MRWAKKFRPTISLRHVFADGVGAAPSGDVLLGNLLRVPTCRTYSAVASSNRGTPSPSVRADLVGRRARLFTPNQTRNQTLPASHPHRSPAVPIAAVNSRSQLKRTHGSIFMSGSGSILASAEGGLRSIQDAFCVLLSAAREGLSLVDVRSEGTLLPMPTSAIQYCMGV